MLAKRISAIVFLLILLLVPAMMWLSGGFEELPALQLDELRTGQYAAKLETCFQQNFPRREALSNFAWNLRFRTGAKEIDGYFVTDTSIIKNVGSPNTAFVRDNNEIILKFAQRVSLPTCFMLLPTASAVKQQMLPSFATPYNQKTFIEGVYQGFGGELTTVDAYPILFSNQDKNLYYNTEDALTPLGGYYIYTVLSAKLKVMRTNPMNTFIIEYAMHNYEGSLKTRFPYAEVKGDVITLYHYRNDKISRTYKIKRTEGDRVYHLNDLYDRSRLNGDKPLDVYFGGLSQLVDIEVMTGAGKPNPSQTKLLILGDETTKSYVPFLAPQFGEIKLVNATTATAEQIENIDLMYYDQVLFAFSTDTYMHNENLSVLQGL